MIIALTAATQICCLQNKQSHDTMKTIMMMMMMMIQTDMMLLLPACYDPLKLQRKWIPPNNETQNNNNN
jgi:hypothetical protein